MYILWEWKQSIPLCVASCPFGLNKRDVLLLLPQDAKHVYCAMEAKHCQFAIGCMEIEMLVFLLPFSWLCEARGFASTDTI
jgi:hypothetical protein